MLLYSTSCQAPFPWQQRLQVALGGAVAEKQNTCTVDAQRERSESGVIKALLNRI